jgi:hypothetical protein
MSEYATEDEHLRQIARRLEEIVALRAAFAPFLATLRARSDRLHQAGEWRQLLPLWRPCQARVDCLLDAAGAASLHILRQEMEDTLVEEAHHPAALVDLAGAFDQACEDLLLRAVQELKDAVDGELTAKSRRG